MVVALQLFLLKDRASNAQENRKLLTAVGFEYS